MIQANDMQVNGNHYVSKYQHWDLCVNTQLGYLEAQVTRYLTRWRKKDGLVDLKKALHYANKLLEVAPRVAPFRGSLKFGVEWVRDEGHSFCVENHIEGLERDLILVYVSWQQEHELITARDMICELMDDFEASPVPLTEENHHAERASQ